MLDEIVLDIIVLAVEVIVCWLLLVVVMLDPLDIVCGAKIYLTFIICEKLFPYFLQNILLQSEFPMPKYTGINASTIPTTTTAAIITIPITNGELSY